MTHYHKNEKLDLDSLDGIWLDYKDHVWYFFIKDRVWQKEEIQRAEHSDITVSFIQEGIVDAFVLTIYDCLEPSDLPFCIRDASEDLTRSLEDQKEYDYEIVLINEDNTVAAVRDHAFSAENSQLLKEKLAERLQESYTSDDFDAAYEKLVLKEEPYEMEEKHAVFTEKSR